MYTDIAFRSYIYSRTGTCCLQARLQSVAAVDASLDSRPLLDAVDPRLDVGELVEIKASAGRNARPAKDLDVCNAVRAQDILAALEMVVEDAVQTLRLVEVPVDGVRARDTRISTNGRQAMEKKRTSSPARKG